VAPQLAVINIVNLLPSNVNLRDGVSRFVRGWWRRLEKLNYRRWLSQVETIVVASKEMKKYAVQTFGVKRSRLYILPDFLPLAFQGRAFDRYPACSEVADGNPRIIFLGAPERYGTEIDAIDEQFMAIANEQIHIYSGAMSEDVKSTGFGHTYSIFSDREVFAGRLAEFASQFEAALITYNVVKRNERFRSTYPTRFFTALTAGIPIAIRGGIFDTCERFVKEHEIGFVYNNPKELREKLMDKMMLFKYRANTQESMKFMNAEAQGPELRAIIENLLTSKGS